MTEAWPEAIRGAAAVLQGPPPPAAQPVRAQRSDRPLTERATAAGAALMSHTGCMLTWTVLGVTTVASARQDGDVAPAAPRWQSVSSTRAYEQCPRRYWYGYVAREPEDRPVPPSWRVGSAVHAALEAAYRRQAEEPWGAVSEHLPAALDALAAAWDRLELARHDGSDTRAARWVAQTLRTDVLGATRVLGVEEPLRDTSTASYRIIGFADLLLSRGGDSIEVVDHKVTRRQATSAALAGDLQLNLYGALVRARWGDHVEVRATLHYPIIPAAVTVTLTPSGMEAARTRVLTVADDARADTTFEPVPGRHCDHCPWQPRCPAGQGAGREEGSVSPAGD